MSDAEADFSQSSGPKLWAFGDFQIHEEWFYQAQLSVDASQTTGNRQKADFVGKPD